MKAKHKRKHSLVGRVALAASLVYSFCFLIIFLANFITTRNIMVSDTEELLHERVNYYESMVNKWVDIRVEHVNIIKHNIETMSEEERTKENLYKMLVESTGYGISKGATSDYIVYPNNDMICGDGWIPDPGYTPTQNEYYKEPASSGETYVSTPYIDASTEEFIITISMPVYVDDKLYCVLARDLYIDEVCAIPNEYDNSNGSYIYLLDREKNIISHINPKYAPSGEVVHNVSEFKELSFMGTLSGMEGLYRTADYDGECFIEKTNSVTGWILGISYPQKINTDRLEKQLVTSLCIAIVILSLSLIMILPFLRKRLKPIKKIVVAAQEIEKGNLDIHYDIKSRDEIGQLADTFKNTTDYLKDIIGEISYILTQIAEGNLNVKTGCEYRGEFKQIQDAIRHILSSLNDIIGGIRNASEQVAFSSGHVADGADLLSRSSLEQAAQIDILVDSCDNVSRIVNDNAQKCKRAGGITEEVSQKLEQSNKQMREMIDAMEHISESSRQISAVNKTIEDIAFQTNILSLNAAVEAARVGELGKGFAVVADEVRALAEKSADASKNTTELINTSINAVGSGAEISDNTAKSLEETVIIEQQVYELIQEIVHLSQEQTQEISRIADGIKSISDIIQTNSSTAQESAAASKELSNQAQTMKELVSHFKISEKKHR